MLLSTFGKLKINNVSGELLRSTATTKWSLSAVATKLPHALQVAGGWKVSNRYCDLVKQKAVSGSELRMHMFGGIFPQHRRRNMTQSTPDSKISSLAKDRSTV